MRKSFIISIVYPPTTLAFSHPSFGKERNGDTTDWLNYHQIWRRILISIILLQHLQHTLVSNFKSKSYRYCRYRCRCIADTLSATPA